MENDKLYNRYLKDLKEKVGLESVNTTLLAAIVADISEHVQDKDKALVACSDEAELEAIKQRFLIGQFGLEDSVVLDDALASACKQYAAAKSKKHLGVYLYLLLVHLGQEGVYDQGKAVHYPLSSGTTTTSFSEYPEEGFIVAMLRKRLNQEAATLDTAINQGVKHHKMAPLALLKAGQKNLGTVVLGKTTTHVLLDYALHNLTGLDTSTLSEFLLSRQQTHPDHLDYHENFVVDQQFSSDLALAVEGTLLAQTANQLYTQKITCEVVIRHLALHGSGTVIAPATLSNMQLGIQELYVSNLSMHDAVIQVGLGDLEVFSPIKRQLETYLTDVVRTSISHFVKHTYRSIVNQQLETVRFPSERIVLPVFVD